MRYGIDILERRGRNAPSAWKAMLWLVTLYFVDVVAERAQEKGRG
jgi:hypothetical protein